jgi:hypothetical protein
VDRIADVERRIAALEQQHRDTVTEGSDGG